MIKGSGGFLNRAMFNLTHRYQHWITASRLPRTNPSPLSATTSLSVSARRRLSLALSSRSPLLRGLTVLRQAIPTSSLFRVGGVIADRADRRRIMVAAQSGVTVSYSLCFTASPSAVVLWLFIRLQHEPTAEFFRAPVAVLIGAALVAGSVLRIVLSKVKLSRLEPQPTPRCFEAPAPI